MSRIVVFGAAGKAGSRVVTEAAARGHEVTAVARALSRMDSIPSGVRAVSGDVTDPDTVAAVAKDADALVLTVGGPDARLYTDAVATVAEAVRALGPTGPRILHMGGGASLLNPEGVRFYDAPGFPEEFKPYAIGQIQALDAYLALPEGDGISWTYLSPPPVHFAPGQRTGHYRTGLDHPVTGEDGQARISYEDYAAALVDEIENPRHLGRRFTVGY
ncbi:NAD(P)-dependent oxidoreductase [Streptomyces sp. NPDC013157]|uniref:NAD(P)-dependent oxidoreductase n=1 Tax=Streptomyces sp. NPDC013157 TaxID=3364861 RepID=UPI0036A64C2A